MESPKKKLKLFDITTTKDILDWKIKTFTDIIFLSCQSYGTLNSMVHDSDRLKQFKIKYVDLLKTCHANIVKIYIIINSLSIKQQEIFINIHKSLQNPAGSFNVVDAGPGTGKTFLIAMLLLSYSEDVLYMVYSKRLMNILNVIQFNGDAKTCCKSLMDMLNIKYYDAKYLWSCTNSTFQEKCSNIYKKVENITNTELMYSLYILDEDSVVSPWHIYFLFCLGSLYNKHVLFMGDRYQQNSINKTNYHNQSNYSLICSIKNIHVLNLHERIRQQTDVEFINILENISNIFKSYNLNVEIKFNFALKYKIFNLLCKHFILKENFDTLFISQYHQEIKKRLCRYEKYIIDNKISYTRAPFMLKIKDKFIKAEIKENVKFLNYIVLVKNKRYIYNPTAEFQYIIELIDFDEEKNYIIAKNLNNLEIIKIHRIRIQSFFIPEEYLVLLPVGLYQFPIKPLISTYHGAQGLTIHNDNIELDLDCSTLNSFYVGITRITERKQLQKIHTKDLSSLIITLTKNDDYYYRISSLYNGLLAELVFLETTKVSEFNSQVIFRNIKIKKNKFDIITQQPVETNLIKLIKKLSGIPINQYNIVFNEL